MIWMPINKDTPKDRLILVFAPGVDGLEDLYSVCKWHEDAGFCIDEIRQPTLWFDIPRVPE